MWWGKRQALVAGVLTAVVAAAGACGGGEGGSENVANTYNTLKPGTLTVAVQPYMPYSAARGDKLVGLDSEVLQHVASKLNLKLEPQVTDFNGMLGSIQSRRADITIGGIAWTKERQQQGLFTDPPYYSPPAMAVHGDGQYPTVESLNGLSMGTVTGYVWVKSIQAVPGARLRTYPNANGVFNDLGAGRITVGFLDPLLIIYTQRQRPDLKFGTRYLTPPTDAQVEQNKNLEYLRPYMTSFYIPKESPKLEEAISKGIRDMYADGTMTSLIKKYGGDPNQFLKASPWMAAQRQGVDRPAGWQPPSV